jgi:hypothetical protein
MRELQETGGKVQIKVFDFANVMVEWKTFEEPWDLPKADFVDVYVGEVWEKLANGKIKRFIVEVL